MEMEWTKMYYIQTMWQCETGHDRKRYPVVRTNCPEEICCKYCESTVKDGTQLPSEILGVLLHRLRTQWLWKEIEQYVFHSSDAEPLASKPPCYRLYAIWTVRPRWRLALDQLPVTPIEHEWRCTSMGKYSVRGSTTRKKYCKWYSSASPTSTSTVRTGKEV